MKSILSLTFVITICLDVHAGPIAPAPAPYGATPSPLQVKHLEMATYAMCCFTVDTYTGTEWGTGAEKEDIVNPTQFDPDQIVSAVQSAGLKGLILVCKHHDGYCLWPTATTSHNISGSPYKGGKGDLVREISDACRRHGLKFGIYVSPWDRNNGLYGTPEYVTQVYRNQLRELLTNYGPLFEAWFDGANGGTGYYGGKGGGRAVDKSTYYGWDTNWAMIRQLQPQCVIFSDCGPDSRWCGNESGNAADPCRATITFEPKASPGYLNSPKLAAGELGGKSWCEAEVDVSIRPGWFWHESENASVRSPENLMGIYLNSVGHGATLDLSVPPDRRGMVHENDVASLKAFGEHLRQTFAENLAVGSRITASNTRGKDGVADPFYGPQNLVDGDPWSAWVTDDAVTTPEVTFELPAEKTFNLIRLREDIRLGLRVESVAVDSWDSQSGAWKEIAKAESIGACHLWRVPKTTTSKVRIRVTKSPVCPALSDFGLYLEPDFAPWIPPVGSSPEAAQKIGWKILACSYQAPGGEASHAIDGNPNTIWHTYGPDGEHTLPQWIAVDMGKVKAIKGFTYLPRQDHNFHGMVDRYAFCVSTDGKQWQQVAEGEFGNLRANPIEQTISFPPVRARYFKFIAEHALELNVAAVAEIGVIE